MTVREIDRVYRFAYKELVERCIDAPFIRDISIPGVEGSFSIDGSFVRSTGKRREHWCHRTVDGSGRRRRRYVGPVVDPQINDSVEDFRRIKEDRHGRRRLVSLLTREARLPAAEPFAGNVVEALAEAGLFRAWGVLIGTDAFRCYPGLLGVRMPSSSTRTGHADPVPFHSVTVVVQEPIPPIVDPLLAVDASFREIPGLGDPVRLAQFETQDRHRVEFLTPNLDSDEDHGVPAGMQSPGGVGARSPCLLEFLTYEPIRSVMLHRGGVSVFVPAPERFAVHKLILASRRLDDGNGRMKREKDLRQASLIAEALIASGRQADLADIYDEAWKHGPSWRAALMDGLGHMSAPRRDAFRDGLLAGLEEIGLDASEYALDA